MTPRARFVACAAEAAYSVDAPTADRAGLYARLHVAALLVDDGDLEALVRHAEALGAGRTHAEVGAQRRAEWEASHG